MAADSTILESIDEDARRQFELAWHEGRPEPIERFLSPLGHPHHLPTLKELVHIELEMLWKARGRPADDADGTASENPPPLAEHYLARFPELNHPAIVLGLLQ